jgi:glyoxylase-like metal-dependent hydrolase (beta-lactamase superfamily II)
MEGPSEIRPGVYGMGTKKVNWYLVEHEGRLTAIDAGLPRMADSLAKELLAIGRTPADIEAVVLTHSDSDHTGLAPTFREAGARVFVHADDDATLRKPAPKRGDASPRNILPLVVNGGMWSLMWHLVWRGAAKPASVRGAATFSDGELLEVPGRPRVIHTPGHTSGHCALLFAEHGALFVGDALCTWNPVTGSRVPQLMPKAFNESNAQGLSSLEKLEKLEAEVVLPGHGEPFRQGPAAAVESARGLAKI